MVCWTILPMSSNNEFNVIQCLICWYSRKPKTIIIVFLVIAFDKEDNSHYSVNELFHVIVLPLKNDFVNIMPAREVLRIFLPSNWRFLWKIMMNILKANRVCWIDKLLTCQVHVHFSLQKIKNILSEIYLFLKVLCT